MNKDNGKPGVPRPLSPPPPPRRDKPGLPKPVSPLPPPLPPRSNPPAAKEAVTPMEPAPVPPRVASAERDTEIACNGPLAGLKVVTLAPGNLSEADLGIASSPDKRARDPYLGATVDNRYKIEATLGEGGMGVVYRCRHTIIGKKVAMKVLRADLARDQEVTERFLNEAKAASAIGNPHIIDISDFGRFPDGSTYFVMEYLEGAPLSDLLHDQQPVPVPRILHIARQLAEGLHAAHSEGIVHRDLKPDNIFLISRGAQKDFVKILDFGIAKVSNHEGKLTRAGAVFGTPHYMSPEQAAGTSVDHRGDIYSFGVILYELASGKVPFDADNFMGILTQHMYKAPVPIRALVPVPQDVPPGLEAIILKCLSKRPEQRYETMESLLLDLVRLGDGLVPEAVPEMMARSGGFNVPADYFKKLAGVPAVQRPRALGRSRWPLYAGVTAVSAAVGIVIAILISGSPSPANPQPQVAATPAVPVASASGAAAGSATVAPAEATQQVVIAAVPPEAELFSGDQSLGVSPVVLQIREGDKLEVVAKLSGYVAQSFLVDGSKDRFTVKLDRAPATPPKKGTRPKTDAKPKVKEQTMGGAEILNPWEQKK